MGIHYSRLREHTEDDKISKTPQVKIILKHLPKQAGPDHKVEREKIVEAMDKDPEFVSKQGAAKILNFYIPKLVEAGIVEKHTTVEEKAPEDKPAAEKSAPKKKGGKGKPAEAKVPEPEPDALEDGEDEGDED